jgi:hypothetical protein
VDHFQFARGKFKALDEMNDFYQTMLARAPQETHAEALRIHQVLGLFCKRMLPVFDLVAEMGGRLAILV